MTVPSSLVVIWPEALLATGHECLSLQCRRYIIVGWAVAGGILGFTHHRHPCPVGQSVSRYQTARG